jgi:alpha-beta hydrolase superfamily lysophospholipase
MLARVLAAEGFYVLRYHGPGSGDSEMAAGEATLEHYVSSAADAADLLHERVPSIANVGFVGARFGGTVAALAHERSGRSALVLWEPVVRGRTFMRSLIRQAIASRVTLGAAGGSFDEMQNVMRHDGFIDLQGVPLHRDLFDDITRIDLVRDLTIPPRHSLIVQVSAATTAKQDLNRLTKRRSDLGSHSSMTFATSPDAARFGGPKFKPAGNGRKVDAQAEIGGVLASVTVEWIRNIDWTSGGFG